jgi:hypothetical protein
MKWLKRKPLMFLLLVASLCLSLAGSAFAFKDVGKDPEKSSIERLEKMGILKGYGKGNFSPAKSMNVASAVSLIVRGMELNIDNIQSIKKPKASDYYSKVNDNAWYAQSFIIAQFNGLDVPQNIDPAAQATREQFAHWLYKALSTKGEYAWIQMYVVMKDEKSIDPAYMESIQKLVISKIAKLDAGQTFRPKQPITRSEAAGMLDRAMEFVKNTKPIEPVDPETTVLSDIKLNSEKINDELVKVTVSATAPNPGYGIDISSVEFHGDQAIVNYRLILPKRGVMYIQKITEVTAVGYISSQYTPVLGKQEKSEPLSGDPVSAKHPIRNPDGTSGDSGSVNGLPSGK